MEKLEDDELVPRIGLMYCLLATNDASHSLKLFLDSNQKTWLNWFKWCAEGRRCFHQSLLCLVEMAHKIHILDFNPTIKVVQGFRNITYAWHVVVPWSCSMVPSHSSIFCSFCYCIDYLDNFWLVEFTCRSSNREYFSYWRILVVVWSNQRFP